MSKGLTAAEIYKALSFISDDIDAALFYVARSFIIGMNNVKGDIYLGIELTKMSKHPDAQWLYTIIGHVKYPLARKDVEFRFASAYATEWEDARFAFIGNRLLNVNYGREDPNDPYAKDSRNSVSRRKAANLGNLVAIRQMIGLKWRAYYALIMRRRDIWAAGYDREQYQIGKWAFNFEFLRLSVRDNYIDFFLSTNKRVREAVDCWTIIARRIGRITLPRDIRKKIGELIWSSRSRD